MNLLDRFTNKKSIFILGTIITGILTFYFCCLKFDNRINGSSLTVNNENAHSMVSNLSVLSLIFVIMGILIIFNATLAGLYYFKKSKVTFIKVEFILFAIMGVLFLVSLPGVTIIFNNASIYKSINLKDINTINITISIFDFICYIAIITYIYNVRIIKKAKGTIPSKSKITFEESASTIKFNTSSKVNQPQYNTDNMQEDQPKFNVFTKRASKDEYDTYSINANKPTTHVEYDLKTGELVEVGDDGNISSISSFFKGKGKIIILIILAAILAFGGYHLFNVISKTTIDLSKNMKVEIAGDDGKGTFKIKSNNIEYDKSNSDMKSFVDNISYEYNTNPYNLYNNDEVIVSIKYDKAEAERLNLNVVGTTRTFTIENLEANYNDASEVPEKLYSLADEKVREELDNKYVSTIATRKSLNSAYFAKALDESESDTIIFIYEINTTIFGSLTRYYEEYEIDCDSLIDPEEEGLNLWGLIIKDENGNYITDSTKIEEKVKEEHSSYTLTSFSE